MDTKKKLNRSLYKDNTINTEYQNKTMSENANHNLASEFKRHPDRAQWLVTKVLPAMEKHFEDFDSNFVISTLTEDTLDARKIKNLYNKQQNKKNKFTPDIKRAQPAYQFFCKANRTQLQEQNPDVGFGDINKMLGDMWAGLNDKEKKPYEKDADKDKKRYQQEYDHAKEEAISSGAFKPDKYEGIKKPKTSYLFFSTDEAVRKRFNKKAGGDIKELMRILGKEWGKMTQKDKQPYVEMAAEDKERFVAEKSAADKKYAKLQKSLEKNKQSDNENENEDNDVETDEEAHVPAKKAAKSKASKSKPSKGKKSAGKKKAKKSVSSDEEDEE